MVTYDFGDGNGPVPAHRHLNGGGWVADTAQVDETAYVGKNTRVYGNARIFGKAWVCDNAWVDGNAMISGIAEVRRNSLVGGDTMLL